MTRLDRLAELLLLLAEVARGVAGGEVVRFKDRTNLDFALLEGAALEPLDGLVHRLHLPQPEASDELLGLAEGSITHRLLRTLEAHALSRGARLEALGRQQHACLHQLLVKLAHLAENPFVRKCSGLRLLVRLHNHHHSHGWSPGFWACVAFVGFVEGALTKSTRRWPNAPRHRASP